MPYVFFAELMLWYRITGHVSIFIIYYMNSYSPPCFILIPTAFWFLMRIIHPKWLNLTVFPLLAALESLIRLYESSGTYRTWWREHFLDLLLPLFILRHTTPWAVAINSWPSPSLTSTGCSNGDSLTNHFLLLRIWLVAPESTIQVQLVLALPSVDRAWSTTRPASGSSPSGLLCVVSHL